MCLDEIQMNKGVLMLVIIAVVLTSCRVQVIERTQKLNTRTGAGTETETEETTATTIDGTPVFDINNGATFTTSLSVTLNLNFSDVTEMYITNTADCADGGSWETYSTSKSWTLATSDAKNTVYAKFQNADGAESKCVSDTIIHDGTAPSAPTNINDGTDIFGSSDAPEITWTESIDSGSGISHYELALGSTPGQDDVMAWQTIGNVNTISLSNLSLSSGTTYYVSLRAVDEGGLKSSIASGDGFTKQLFWQQKAYLKPSDTGSGFDFGNAVAIEGDTVVIGAKNNTNDGKGGAAFVYKRTGTTWSETKELRPANSSVRYGYDVAIAGDTIAVAAKDDASNQTTITNGTSASSDTSALWSGAVFVYRYSGSDWQQEAYVKAINADAGDRFGTSVSLSGDRMAVGAWKEDSNQTTITNGTSASADNSVNTTGAVYVYKRTGTTWAQEAYIKSINADSSDGAGEPVSLDGDTLAVAVIGESSNQTTITNGTTASGDNSLSGAGAVYVYRRNGSNWTQEAFIKPPNPDSLDYFGLPCDLSGDRLAVGAWGESSNQTTITNGTSASLDNSVSGAGAAYIFRRTGTNWQQEAYLKPPNPQASGIYGPIAIEGDYVVVGSKGESSNQTTITHGTTASTDTSTSQAGAAYLYKYENGKWQQKAYIKASNATAGIQLGHAVTISGQTIVIGAPSESSNQTTVTNGSTASSDTSLSGAGAAYIFTGE